MEQRTIKFRAWDKDRKRMVQGGLSFDYENQIHEEENIGVNNLYGAESEQIEEFELMQFTGLLDKNGKEIYESDYLEDVSGGILCVYWGSGKYILQNISSGDIIDCNETNTQNKTIVGNRFESPREHASMETDL